MLDVFQFFIETKKAKMFNSLYKLWSNESVVGFITSWNEVSAVALYKQYGGKAENVTAEKMTFGYFEEVRTVYR